MTKRPLTNVAASVRERLQPPPSNWRGLSVPASALPGAPRDFSQAGERIQAFLGPVWAALVAGRRFANTWPPGGTWAAVS